MRCASVGRCLVLVLAFCIVKTISGQQVNEAHVLDLIKKVQGAGDRQAFVSGLASEAAQESSDGPFIACIPPALCMPMAECSHTGPMCAPSSVCCFSFDSDLGSNGSMPTGPVINSSDNVDMRSVRGSQGFQDSFGQRYQNSPQDPRFQAAQRDNLESAETSQATPAQRSGVPTYNQHRGNSYGGNAYGSGYNSGGYNKGYGGRNNYGGGYDPAWTGSYGHGGQGHHNPTGYSAGGYPAGGHRKPGYGNRPDYGSFDHAYGSQFGHFAPDFYGPQYDLRGLSIPARDVLHKFRFQQVCGIKRPDLFPALPFGPQPPVPYGRPAPYPPHPVHPGKKLGEHPWQAAVLGWSPRGYGLRCSATLVHPQLLVTSGHCLKGIVEPELKVLLGVTDLLTPVPFLPTIERAVARIFVHEEFNHVTLTHDVALLLLAKPVDLHFTPHVAPVCLPGQNQTFVATNCYIVSWSRGDQYRGGPRPRSNEIRISDMTFIPSKSDCEHKVSQFASHLNPSQLTEEMHCIKGTSPTSCMGSAGGSLFCDVDTPASCTGPECHVTKTSYLAGILSWSNEKCGDDGLAVITELSPYVPWIEGLLAGAGGLQNFNPAYFGNLAGPVHGQGGHYGGHPGGHPGGHSGYPKPGYGGSGYDHHPSTGYGAQGFGRYPKPAYGGYKGNQGYSHGFGSHQSSGYGHQDYGSYPSSGYSHSAPSYRGW